MTSLQIVTEKPQPPLWCSDGFDERKAAVIYRNRMTGEQVLWSAPTMPDVGGATVGVKAALSVLTNEPQTYEELLDKLGAAGYNLADRTQRQTLSGALYNLKRNRRATKTDDGRWMLTFDPSVHITVGSFTSRALEAVCDKPGRPRDIAAALGVSISNASKYLIRLHQAGYVHRVRINNVLSTYHPTEVGIIENRRLRAARRCNEVRLTKIQERALLAVAEGNTTRHEVVGAGDIEIHSVGAALMALVRRGLVNRTPAGPRRHRYTITDAGRKLAKVLR